MLLISEGKMKMVFSLLPSKIFGWERQTKLDHWKRVFLNNRPNRDESFFINWRWKFDLNYDILSFVRLFTFQLLSKLNDQREREREREKDENVTFLPAGFDLTEKKRTGGDKKCSELLMSETFCQSQKWGSFNVGDKTKYSRKITAS